MLVQQMIISELKPFQQREIRIFLFYQIFRVEKERNSAKPQICGVKGLRGKREPA